MKRFLNRDRSGRLVRAAAGPRDCPGVQCRVQAGLVEWTLRTSECSAGPAKHLGRLLEGCSLVVIHVQLDHLVRPAASDHGRQ